MKNSGFLIPLFIAVSMASGLYLGNVLADKTEPVAINTDSKYQKIQDILQILDRKYVDSVNSERLFEETIGNMLHTLDPHSNYIPASEIEAMNEEIRGNFGGVGIRFFIIRDTVCITNVLNDSPSMAAGLKAGDKIIVVDDEEVTGDITNERIMGMLKGEAGTFVDITVLRNGKTYKKQVRRGTIPVESVTAYYMIDDEIGFVRIDRFSLNTASEFRKAVRVLKDNGLKKLIVDLRNNGGGVLSAATDIADEFLRNNVPIVETRGVHSQKEVIRSTPNGSLKDVEVAILINSNSASASEILAGAIQDNDRGTIIGRRSFGKGLVQEDMVLRDGSTLRLTVARYYTPTGRCIQKPYNGDIEEYYGDQMERYDNGELYSPDSSLFVDSLKFVTPGGKIVYGGGGIMPDIFVPLDTLGSSWYLSQLRYTAAINAFSFDYASSNRNKWSTPKNYAASFNVSDDLLDRFTTYAAKFYDVKLDENGLRQSKTLLKKLLKSEIARQLWMEQGFYEVNNKSDKEVIRAIEHLR